MGLAHLSQKALIVILPLLIDLLWNEILIRSRIDLMSLIDLIILWLYIALDSAVLVSLADY